jgi:hypothetical protein
MELGLLISPFGAPEAAIRRVHELGFSNCFFSLDGYINGFTQELATQFLGLLTKYEVTATTVEVVRPEPLEWNFMRGPSRSCIRAAAPDRGRYRPNAGEGFCKSPSCDTSG